ncbi:uncharacterized protein JCM6883_001692 [Sporobolomyces salmoneus]|uniref:uncharacterized protein n=1 Tax=Sporobolomyces salmoneus TaxID=183962 RepID=UPI00317615C1
MVTGSTSYSTENRRASLNVRLPAQSASIPAGRSLASLTPSPLPFPSSPSTRSPLSNSHRGSITSISFNSPNDSKKKMLPSHPSTLPHFYGSEASISGDDDSEQDAQDRVACAIERKKRDEARQRRRAKQAISSHEREGTPSNLLASPARRRANKTLHDHVEMNGDGRTETLEGLGFKMGLPETDYQVLVDEAAFRPHPARTHATTTYSSSLGSGIPSPDHSPATTVPSRFQRRSRQLSEVSYANEDLQDTPRIILNEVEPVEEADTNHVRFDAASRGEPGRERRSRPRPVNTSVPLESDHIVFPDTLPTSPTEPSAPQTLPSPTSSSFFSRRIAPNSPSKSNNRPPSVNSSHHGNGTYCGSVRSVTSQTTVPRVFDDSTSTSSPFKRSNGGAFGKTRTRSMSTTDETPSSVDPNSSTPPPRSARQARRPGGPTTIVGELLAQQDPTRLYFPSPSPKRPGSTASSERSPPLSIISSVFPSRPRPSTQFNAGSISPAISSSSRLPFPPPPASSKSTSSLVFPPPPPVFSSSPQLGRSDYAPRPSPSLRNGMHNSPSFASTVSSMSNQSIEQPVFPMLGAQLSSNGLVKSGITPRRVSGTPWERSSQGAGDSIDEGDELDRMMAAQRTAASDDESVDVTEAKHREREKERKRRDIYNELIRTNTSDSLA